MGNTCIKKSPRISETIDLFQSVSNAIPIGLYVLPPDSDDQEKNNPTSSHGVKIAHIETTSEDTKIKLESSPPPVLVPNKPLELVELETLKQEEPEPVSNPPINPEKSFQRAPMRQADYVLGRKTCHLKDLYRLGRKLGEGNFGNTFLCVEKETGKEYACKSIAKWRLKEKEDVEDVRREIQIMQHLAVAENQHPNVISIKGAYEDDVEVHIVMELCSGGELYDRINKNGHCTEKKAAELARIIVGAVEACHSLGVMHRDLKPENFLYVNEKDDSPLKLIDFGLSVFFKPGETVNEVVGTPYYIAPEVLRKEQYGPEADIWSVGVIIYIMLSGGPPFWAETEREIIKRVLYGGLNFTSHPWPNISENAKDLVKKMLMRDPKRRLTAREVLCHPWVDQKDDGVAHPDNSS